MKGAKRLYTLVKQDEWNNFIPSFIFMMKTDGSTEYLKELFHWSCTAEILL